MENVDEMEGASKGLAIRGLEGRVTEVAVVLENEGSKKGET